MVNSTQCVINPKEPHEFMLPILKNFHAISYSDGMLKAPDQATNKYQYDIHLFARKRRKYKSINIGKWEFYEADSKQRHEYSELYPRFELDLTQLRKNEAKNHLRFKCSEECNAGYIRIRDANAQKSHCCWSCQPCPPNNIVRNDSCISCDETETVVAGNCIPLPEYYFNM